MFYYTENNVDIGDRVREGRTLLFENELEAIQKARELKTYHYQVFNAERKHIGYAVPR